MSKNGELDVPHPHAWAWGWMSKHGDDGCPTSPSLDIRTSPSNKAWGCGNRDLELPANGGNDMFGHTSLWN
ncbi:unnamed protein product [Sphagnum tenellum]